MSHCALLSPKVFIHPFTFYFAKHLNYVTDLLILLNMWVWVLKRRCWLSSFPRTVSIVLCYCVSSPCSHVHRVLKVTCSSPYVKDLGRGMHHLLCHASLASFNKVLFPHLCTYDLD